MPGNEWQQVQASRWVKQHPEFYVQGSAADLEREPYNYRLVETPGGSLILAYGRDPYFAGWPDTLQLNYGNPDLQQASQYYWLRTRQPKAPSRFALDEQAAADLWELSQKFCGLPD